MKTISHLILGICLAVAAPGFAAKADRSVTTATKEFAEGFTGELERVAAGHDGVMGIYVKNLETGKEFRVNASEQFPTASTIKLAVMCAAFAKLDAGDGPFDSYYDTIVYDAATSTGGAGLIRNYKDGTKLELKELIHLMITVSDNIATNMLSEWLGLEAINQWLVEHKFETTRMFALVGGRKVYDPEGRKKDWGLGVTTPEEMGRLMELIVTGGAGSAAATDEMLRILGHQYFDGAIAAAVPPMTYVGSKSGALNRSRSDVAVVASPAGKYILSVYTKDNVDTSWGNSNKAEAAIRSVSKVVWDHFNEETPYTPPAGTEKY